VEAKNLAQTRVNCVKCSHLKICLLYPHNCHAILVGGASAFIICRATDFYCVLPICERKYVQKPLLQVFKVKIYKRKGHQAVLHRAVNGPHLKPEPGPSTTFICEAQFRPERQFYRESQDKRNCGVSKNLVYGYTCKCTVLLHLDQNIGFNKHKLSLLVNDNAAKCNVSQEKMKLSRNCIHDGAVGIKKAI